MAKGKDPMFVEIDEALVECLALSREARHHDPYIDDYPTQRAINRTIRAEKFQEIAGHLKRVLKLVGVVVIVVLAASSALALQSMVELDLRRGSAGTVRFDAQNQRFLACVGTDCAEVIFK